MGAQEADLVRGRQHAESEAEEQALLLQQPAAQFLGAAVGEPRHKVAHHVLARAGLCAPAGHAEVLGDQRTAQFIQLGALLAARARLLQPTQHAQPVERETLKLLERHLALLGGSKGARDAGSA